jgi:hypothetical protein
LALQELAAHARVPEALDMAGHAFDRHGMVGFRMEEGCDLIGHLHQLVPLHREISTP